MCDLGSLRLGVMIRVAEGAVGVGSDSTSAVQVAERVIEVIIGEHVIEIDGVLFFFQAEDGIRDYKVTGVQTCALPIWPRDRQGRRGKRASDRPWVALLARRKGDAPRGGSVAARVRRPACPRPAERK